VSARVQAILVALAVALQAGLAIDSLHGNSATFDEGTHLPAGWTHLALGDHRLNPEQPPLVKLLAAAPLALVRPVVRQDDRAWIEARQWDFGRRFLYRWNDADRLLFLGRLPVVALASALVVAVFLEARRRFGAAAGAMAALAAALSPDVLAHGSLVTTDLGFALFYFLAIALFCRLLEEATPPRLLAAGLATGAAFATKFSAPLAAVALATVAGGVPLRWRAFGREHHPAGFLARSAHAAALLAAVALIALAVLWASYGFRHDLSPDPAARAAGLATLQAPIASPWLRGLAAVSRAGALPEDYARGMLFVMTHSEARPTFLAGQLSDHGFPQYFLLTFLLKTPVPLLVLTALALGRVTRLRRRHLVFVWLPVLVYLALSLTRGLQIGHRHLLPIYPFLFLACAEAAIRLASWRRPAGVVLVALLGAWYAGGTLWTHPHHLAYFNELAGGPANGWRLLVDSNLDWGQDLKRLAAWTRANRVTRLKLSYFGSADPAYYGIDAEMLPGYTSPHAPHVTREIVPGDVVAVSVTNLQGVYLDPADRPLMEKLRALEPIARAGWSIRIYRADFRWPEPGAGAAP
jgi:hypothetical protein